MKYARQGQNIAKLNNTIALALKFLMKSIVGKIVQHAHVEVSSRIKQLKSMNAWISEQV